ncbi:glycosyltransferase [Robertkochia marina]|uniref:Glycosyltransferase n=1 Tax=Robertkochia marina TaxID=1227945 RepID=A0A4S3LXJ2_9FLAO|nr:glycosyltransferase [Robertkochia marina]THD66269.1 glycosyltransferase [Robertkochia marina]TRZ40907.1 glycosyltransferase [Robertkochia marina]
MKILIVDNSVIPVNLYGGTERVIWALGKELTDLGHSVTYLVKKGSSCDFASVIPIDDDIPLLKQIPADTEVVHFNFFPENLEDLNVPYIITMHGNVNNEFVFDKNTVFVSKNHAERYGSVSYVHKGLDWSQYSKPNVNRYSNSFHFLGRAAWGVKNLKGAIDIIKKVKQENLNVLGGRRFSERVFKLGPTYMFSRKVNFRGMVGGVEKETYLNQSRGLIFPVLWHEPFGLAIIESLFYGCPVFGTPYGSLKEIVIPEAGFLSNKKDVIAEAIANDYHYNPRWCHEYAVENFNSKIMALRYLEKYDTVLKGKTLNETNPQLKVIQKERYLPFD